MPHPRTRKARKDPDHITVGPLDLVERELYPDRPYHLLTREQREHTYVVVKERIFRATGRRIP